MNCQLRDITVTARDGRVSHLDQVYIRGSHVRYFIVPDMLRLVEGTQRDRSYADKSTTETHPCSELETCAEEVLVWPEVAPLSTEPEAKEVDPVDKWERQQFRLDYEYQEKRGPKVSRQQSILASDMSLRVVQPVGG